MAAWTARRPRATARLATALFVLVALFAYIGGGGGVRDGAGINAGGSWIGYSGGGGGGGGGGRVGLGVHAQAVSSHAAERARLQAESNAQQLGFESLDELRAATGCTDEHCAYTDEELNEAAEDILAMAGVDALSAELHDVYSSVITTGEYQVMLFNARRYDELLEHWFNDLLTFASQPIVDARTYDGWVATFLDLFTRFNFTLTREYTKLLLHYHSILHAVISISAVGNTDSVIELLQSYMHTEKGLYRFLVLYHMSNSQWVDPHTLFKADAELATDWYLNALRCIEYGMADATTAAHLAQLTAHIDPLMTEWNNRHFYLASYLTQPEGGGDIAMRRRVNEYFHQVPAPANTKYVSVSADNRNRVLIVASVYAWRAGSSRARTLHAAVEAIRDAFETDVMIEGSPLYLDDDDMEFLETDGGGSGRFHDVTFFDVHEYNNDHRWMVGEMARHIMARRYALILFTDVQDHPGGLWLANLRLAPVQVTVPPIGLGPASEVDFVLTGRDVERIDLLSAIYSERVVLLPGLGITLDRRQYTWQKWWQAEPAVLLDGEPFYVMVPWSAARTSHASLMLLKRIREKAHRAMARAGTPLELKYVFFPNIGDALEFIAFEKTVMAALAGQALVMPKLDRAVYLTEVAKGHLVVDAKGVSSANAAMDALYVRVPMVMYAGERWYNRVGAAMNLRVGMGEMVAVSDKEYVDTCVRYVTDAAFRERMRLKLAAADLDAAFFTGGELEAQYWPTALRTIIDEYDPGVDTRTLQQVINIK